MGYIILVITTVEELWLQKDVYCRPHPPLLVEDFTLPLILVKAS